MASTAACSQMEAEGVTFHYNVDIGNGRPFRSLIDDYDAVLLAIGAERPRDPQHSGSRASPAAISPCRFLSSRTSG